MPLALRLPPLSEQSANAPETRPSRVAAWLTETLTREPGFAARVIGDALAATNRVSLGHSRRLDLTEQYWKSAALLWPRLERQFTRASHPLQGDNLDAAKASLTLANELSTAYKRLLVREASRRFRWAARGARSRSSAARSRRRPACSPTATSSYAPVPPQTWHDAHDIYMYTRERENPPPSRDARPARRHARAALRAVAAARARESVRLPAEPAADGAELPAASTRSSRS